MTNAHKSAEFQQSLSRKFRIHASNPKKQSRRCTLSHAFPVEESLKQLEWDIIESRALKQCITTCAICFGFFEEDLNQGLLSCGHVFHESCFDSFERYCGESSSFCPICRESSYSVKRTNIGFESRKNKSAVMIQSCIRGYLHRNKARTYWKVYYQSTANSNANNAVRRKKFFREELANLSCRVVRHIDSNHNQMENLLQSVEKSLQMSKKLDTMLKNFEGMKKEGHDIPWELVLKAALDRNETMDCAICMVSMKRTNIFVLSCTHAFHERCFSSLESYCSSHSEMKVSKQCPVCRSSFEKMHHYVE